MRWPSSAAVGLLASGLTTVSDTGACCAKRTPVAIAATAHAASLIRLFIVKETITHGPNAFVHERARNSGPGFRPAGCRFRKDGDAQRRRRLEGHAGDVHLSPLPVCEARAGGARENRPRLRRPRRGHRREDRK